MTDPFNPDQPSLPEYEPGRGDPEPSGEPDMLPDATPQEMPDTGPMGYGAPVGPGAAPFNPD